METRARHLLVGLFSLAVIAGGLFFVYWLNNAGGLAGRALYQLRFENAVAGLRQGSPVLFNGIRVGEVTRLQLDRDDPGQVMATITVQAGTPIRADTSVGVETQGFMGAPAVTLRGGKRDAPALAGSGSIAGTLSADASATEDMTQTARDTLRVIRKVVSDNAEPLHATIENLNTFSGALARNSDRVDGILAGLEKMTGGGGNKPQPSYDLREPKNLPDFGKRSERKLVVQDPTALVVFDTQRILIRRSGGEMLPIESALWTDTLPKLVQAKIIQAFEAAGYEGAVSRPTDGGSDYQLLLDIRSFQVVAGDEPQAHVELSARLLGEDGKVLGAQTFRATASVKALDAPAAVAGLSEAFGQAAANLLTWADGLIQA